MDKVSITYSSIPKTAKRIGISTSSYYREMKKGNLPAGTKVGDRRIVADHLVDEALLGGANDESCESTTRWCNKAIKGFEKETAS